MAAGDIKKGSWAKDLTGGHGLKDVNVLYIEDGEGKVVVPIADGAHNAGGGATITTVAGVITEKTAPAVPIADGAHDVGSGATITTVSGVITEKTAPETPVDAQTWVVAVGDSVVIGEGGIITSITPA